MAKSKLEILIVGKDQASPALKKVNKALGETEKATNLISSAWKLAGAAVIAGAGAFIISSTKLAARVETLGVVTVKLGENIGWSEEKIRGLEQSLVDTGITLQKSRQSIAMMIQANIDLSKATDLARLAQDAAVIAGVNSSEAFQKLTYVIQTGNIRMARTMGLQADFRGALQKLAKELGKTTAELTEQETIQARTNAVMEAGARITGTYEAAMETAGKQLLSLDRYVEEFKVALGNLFIPVLAETVEWLTKFFTTMTEGLEVANLLLNWNEKIGKAMIENATTYKEYVDGMIKANEATRTRHGVVGVLTEAEWELGNAAQYSGGELGILGQQMMDAHIVVDDLTGAVDGLSSAQLRLQIAEAISAGDYRWAQKLADAYNEAKSLEEQIQKVVDAMIAADGTTADFFVTMTQSGVVYTQGGGDGGGGGGGGSGGGGWGPWQLDALGRKYRRHSDGRYEKGYARGGKLDGTSGRELAPIAEVGEEGFEYIVNGVVIPHGISKTLKKLGLSAGQSFQSGGPAPYGFYAPGIYQTPTSKISPSVAGFIKATKEAVVAAQARGSFILPGMGTSGGGIPSSPAVVAATSAAVAAEVAVEEMGTAVEAAVVGQIQPEVTKQTIAMTSQMAAQRREVQESNALLAQMVLLLQAQANEDALRSIMVESQDTSGF